MSEMRAAARAGDFCSEDPRSADLMYRFSADRLRETRPTGAGVEFVLRAVERVAAGGANISAFAVLKRVATLRRSLRARPAHDMELFRGHDELPFVIRKVDMLIERNGVQLRANLRGVEIARMHARASRRRNADTHA